MEAPDPTPSGSGSSINSTIPRTAIPSTNPNEASMGPAQEEATPRAPAQEMPPPAPPTKKKPLVRRAAKDKEFDPMAQLFTNLPAPTSSVAGIQAEPAGGNTQGGDASQSVPTQASSRSRLKRRAGTTQEGVDDMFFAASKDRDSQGSGSSQSQGNKRQKLADGGEDEEMAEAAGTSQKRKLELVDAPEVVEAKKRLKHQKDFEEKQKAAREAAAEKKAPPKTTAVEDDARAQREEEKAKYLQIDHGKRKVSDQDKQFTKEFNSVCPTTCLV